MISRKYKIPAFLALIVLLLILSRYINPSYVLLLAFASYYLWERENSKSELIMRYVVYFILILIAILAHNGLIV